MQIQIDSREHKSELARIQSQFDDLNVKYYVSKLFVGDYMNLDNPRLIVDRKKDLWEICSNVTQQHERFRNELIRAEEQGIKVIILCEHGNGIKTLNDVFFWENIVWRMVDGRRKRVRRGVPGDVLYKTLNTIQDRYGVRFEFCDKSETGKRIVELLGGDAGG